MSMSPSATSLDPQQLPLHNVPGQAVGVTFSPQGERCDEESNAGPDKAPARPVPQLPPLARQPSSNKKAPDLPQPKPSWFNKFLLFFLPSSRKQADEAQPSAPVPVILKENKPRIITDLRIQIGENRDTATICIVEVLHRRADEETNVELYLNAQAPRSGEAVVGRLVQATLVVKFLDPNSLNPIAIEHHGSLDAEPAPNAASVTEGTENAFSVAGKLAKDPEVTVQYGKKKNVTSAVDNAPIVHGSGLVDVDQEMRWVWEVTGSGPSNVGGINKHGFLLRIGKRLPVKAHIRVSCLCGKDLYSKPGGNGLLEVLLTETEIDKIEQQAEGEEVEGDA
ncbi:hypothetical protein NLJ89_g7348 [Agrocybe chaxingu]|uniref:Uncharacterized protein n=1 Tax=Agrocybe chaxingu TaxID=84603 RepID=A0A9W8JWZ9_9AGAR|nr:hypothetical protein NLJ89_g7348 [Agrocybe chaxingu]